MQQDPPQSSCPDFASVVRAALPVGSSSQGPGARARFLQDVARTYRNPIVKIDFEDLEVVLRGVRSPSLGVGTASGENRAKLATQQAIREASGPFPEHALIVLAFPPRDLRLSESKLARSLVREQMEPNTFIICGLIEDEQLARGTMRVSVLLG